MGELWSLATIIGPILLIAVIIWATLRNRRGSRADYERAERSARAVREDIRRDEDGVQ